MHWTTSGRAAHPSAVEDTVGRRRRRTREPKQSPRPPASIRKQSKNGGRHERHCRRKGNVDRSACWHCVAAGVLIAVPEDKHLSRSCCEGRLARPHRCADGVRFREFAAGAHSRPAGAARCVHSGRRQCAFGRGSATRCLPRRDLQTCADSPRIVLPRPAAQYRWKREIGRAHV